MAGKKITAWVTKYALTTGIEKHESSTTFSDGMIRVRPEEGGLDQFFHGKDWHKTEKAANERAEEMRLKKILSLKKQLKRYESMSFNPITKGDNERTTIA